jgi:hypothetical protein
LAVSALARHPRTLILVRLATSLPAWSEVGVLGQIVTLLLPSVMAAAESGNFSIGGVISQAVAGGAGGAILTAIIAAIKNKAAA